MCKRIYRERASHHSCTVSSCCPGQAEKERDELFEAFGGTVLAVQRRSEARNMALESKLSSISEEFDRKQAQLHEVRTASVWVVGGG